MMRKLFADRFRLSLHKENRELPVYAVNVAKGGSKLSKSESAKTEPLITPLALGSLSFSSTSTGDFCRFLQRIMEQGVHLVHRPVVDETSLTGRFDFALVRTPPELQTANPSLATKALGGDRADLPPDFITAVRQQLGLKLEAVKAAVEILFIDEVEKPADN